MANAGASKSGKKKEGLLDCLTSLEETSKKILRLSQDVKEAESNAEEVQRLRTELEDREGKIEQQEVLNKGLVDKFELKFSSWQEEKQGLEKSLKAAKTEQIATYSRKLESALKEETVAKNKAQKAQAELQEARVQVMGFKAELGTTKQRLGELQECIGMIETTDSLVKEIESLATNFHDLARKYGGCSIPEPNTDDKLFMALYSSKFLDVIPGATPVSNSPQSILLRTATLENILTLKATELLLRDLFPWNIASEANILCSILNDFLKTDPQKEAILRALISSVDSQERDAREEAQKMLVLQELISVCSPLLELHGVQSNFQQDVQTLLVQVADFWAKAQRHERRIVAASNSVKAVTAWGTYEKHGILPDDADQLHTGVLVAVLFPQFYTLLPDGTKEVLHPGYSLWSDQDIHIEGKKEFQVQFNRIKRGGVRTDSQNRRRSISDRRIRNSGTARAS